MTVERRLADLGLELPTPPDPVASYVSFRMSGSTAYLSGHGPMLADGSWIIGKVGRDLGVDDARDAARVTGLAVLSTLRHELGSLDRVVRLVKVLGMVNCTPDFVEHSKVINGFSDLMIALYGDAGRHARSAIGVASLPMGIPVEVEAIIEVERPRGSSVGSTFTPES